VEDESIRLFEIYGPPSGCSWHFHPEFQIGYVASGTGERVIGDAVHAIAPGEVVLLGPNLPHVWRFETTARSQPIDAVAIHFREDFLGGDFLDKPEMCDLRLLLSRASQGLQVVGYTRKAVAEKIQVLRGQSGLARLVTLLSILDEIARSREVFTLSSPMFQPVKAELEVARLTRVYAFVKKNLNQPLDRDTAADIAHMSPGAFSRFFKTHTGMAFHDFVVDVRIGHACKLLVDPNKAITDVAFDSGFADLSTFNRSFRKLRNMTPSEYRNRLRTLCDTHG
jgi:AraC-like DNA-binding protein